MFYLNSYQFTNIHHTMLKPDTYARKTDDGLYTQMGEPIYMIHGHWQEDKYMKNLMEPMEKNYGNYPNALKYAEAAIREIKKEYDRYKC